MSNRSPQPAAGVGKIQRYSAPAAPVPYVVQIHDHDCDCHTCEPYVPSRSDTLTATIIGKLMVAGIAVGLALIFAIDPAGASAALLTTIGR